MSKIWTVRGVPDEVQREAAQAAHAAGMRLGAWVERVLRAALEGGAASGGAQDRSAPAGGVDLVELERRLELVEAELVKLRQRATKRPLRAVEDAEIPTRCSDALEQAHRSAVGRNSRAIPDEHLEEADQLQGGDLSFAQVIEIKGWSYSPTGLANAVARWRRKHLASQSQVSGTPEE